MSTLNTPVKTLALAIAAAALSSVAVAEQLQLEEVVVTAQKRVQNLQDVPISITAMSNEDLEVNGVVDTDSIANLAPNLHIKEVEGGSVTFAIRGLSNNFATNIGFENTVGFYVDGVYQGKNYGTLFELGDVERVEVLRGPQGTLYGRNTIGGAINVISIRPSGEFGGKVKAGIGNSNLKSVSLAVDTPTYGSADQGIGQVRARVSGFTRERDGFTDNETPAFANPTRLPLGDFERFGDIDRQGGRLAIDWDLRDNLRMSYDYTQSELNDTPRLWQLLDVNAAGFTAAYDPLAGAGTGAYIAGLYTQYIPGGNGIPDEGSSNGDLYTKTIIKSHTGTLTWDINDSLTLKSISSVRELENSAWIDLDGTDMLFYDVDRKTEMDQSSQEIQLIGKTDTLNYVAGIYYYEEDGTDRRVTEQGSGVWQQSAIPDNSNKAVFGQIDWTPTSFQAFTLSAGIRRTWEDKNMGRYLTDDPTTSGAASFLVPFEFQSKSAEGNYDPATDTLTSFNMPEISLSNTSVMVSPSYKFTNDITGYYKFSQGFRSGGYDGSAVDTNWIVTPFESEEVDAHEIGMKSRLLNGKMQLNIALFFNQYDNMQLTEFDGSQTHTLNASEADVYGGELELSYLITERLSGSFSYSALDFEYKEWYYNNPSYGIVNKDVTDIGEINNAPKSTANVSLDYDFGKVGAADMSLHVNYNYQDSAHAVAITSVGGAPNSETDSRALLDARLTIATVDRFNRNLELALWGKNLTDKEYVDNVIDLTLIRVGTTASPRTFGVEASVTF